MNIIFDQVSLSFDSEQVLNDLSFKVNSGNTAVLEGDSGSGKSSILRLILGFQTNYEGDIYIDDKKMNAEYARQLRSSIGWVPQFQSIGEGSVEEVITYPFQFRANRQQQPNRKEMLALLQQLRLEPGILAKAYRDLSGGQQQRIGIAICQLLNKPLMLLDEPTTALDDHAKEAVIELLINKNEATILSTSHDDKWVQACEQVISLT